MAERGVDDSQTASAAATTEDAEARGSGRWINAGLVIVALVFMGAIALLYHQWLTKAPARAIVSVIADSTYEGATVVLSNVDPEASSMKRVLEAENQFVCRFPIEPRKPGYRISIRHADGRMEGPFALPAIEEYRVLRVAVGAPATQPYEQ